MIMKETLNSIVGNSPETKKIQHLIEQVANKTATVLILGESGTGKELVARVIHQLSDRQQGPFIAVNCAAIPAELLESELFGHEKGAFTGAIAARQGRFELAIGGTLFLDEIGDMPITMQAKLLRVLQERVFERVGGNKLIQADIRIIAATHQNLQQSIQAGHFREDLYYRLNVFPIYIPPLRERRSDIQILIEHFIQKYQLEMGNTLKISQDALELLVNDYHWPGNVRELSNLMERLFILCAGKSVTVSELSTPFVQQLKGEKSENVVIPVMEKLPYTEKDFDLKEYLMRVELDLMIKALQANQGIVTRAAKKLGLHRTTLVEKMKKYGLSRNVDPNAQWITRL